MQITGITPQKRAGRFNVEVDGVFWAGVSSRTIALHGLYSGRDVSQKELDEIFLDELDDRIYQRCVGLIGRRPRSVSEINRYLSELLWKKGKDWTAGSSYADRLEDVWEKVRSRVISRLERQKLLSDEDFARWWVENRMRSGKKGWIAVRSELQAKGIDRDVIAALEPDPSGELTRARRLYRKLCAEGVVREKCLRRLLSRGFSWDTIRQVVPDQYE